MDAKVAIFAAETAIDSLEKSGQIGSIAVNKEIIFPFTALEFEVIDEEAGISGASIHASTELLEAAVDNKSLTFTFDGTDYLCPANYLEGMGALWGNGSFFGMEDTGEPFAFGVDVNNLQTSFLCITGGIHTAEISIVSEITKPIDPKYIYPHFDLVAMGMPTVQIGGEVRVDVDVATHDKIASAMASGIITAAFTMDLQGVAIPAQGTFPIFFSASMGVYQGCCMLAMAGTPLMFIVTLESTWVSVTCLMLGA